MSGYEGSTHARGPDAGRTALSHVGHTLRRLLDVLCLAHSGDDVDIALMGHLRGRHFLTVQHVFLPQPISPIYFKHMVLASCLINMFLMKCFCFIYTPCQRSCVRPPWKCPLPFRGVLQCSFDVLLLQICLCPRGTPRPPRCSVLGLARDSAMARRPLAFRRSCMSPTALWS